MFLSSMISILILNMDIFLTGLIFIILKIVVSMAQLPTTENLRNATECDVNADFTISCSTNEVIAIQSLLYVYNVLCESVCCNTYSTDDCTEEASNSDIENLRRMCTGKGSCTVTSPQSSLSFCAHGSKPVSYLILRYYCIPTNRVVSICANDKSLTSDGPPLYITNEGFPGVTIGSATCACSFESYSCSSSTNLYTIDAELYLDTDNCEQTIQFTNGADSNLEMIGCGSYYQNSIANNTMSSHYVKIEFINNSTANQEGIFFIGLAASDTDTVFSLSCASQPESWCVECGSLPTISLGTLVLDDPGNTEYQATATVDCSLGYETNSPTISCLANATWENALCSPKDCGNVSSIQNGEIILLDTGNTLYGALANVTCDEGYKTSKAEITCLHTGVWEDIKECLDLQNDGDDGYDGQDGRKKNGGLEVWAIVLIVLAVVVVVIVIGIIIYIKLFSKSKVVSQSVTPDPDEKKRQDDENVKPEIVVLTGQPLPEISKQHEVKHGPIYIEHGEAHVFGLTIHLPFAGKSANQLEPILASNNETEIKKRNERKKKKKAKSQDVL